VLLDRPRERDPLQVPLKHPVPLDLQLVPLDRPLVLLHRTLFQEHLPQVPLLPLVLLDRPLVPLKDMVPLDLQPVLLDHLVLPKLPLLLLVLLSLPLVVPPHQNHLLPPLNHLPPPLGHLPPRDTEANNRINRQPLQLNQHQQQKLNRHRQKLLNLLLAKRNLRALRNQQPHNRHKTICRRRRHISPHQQPALNILHHQHHRLQVDTDADIINGHRSEEIEGKSVFLP
jgi:hypothetical protein